MLELWKPLLKLNDQQNPVVFTELCYKYSTWELAKFSKNIPSDEHPFVIFFDKKENCYYYLKGRGAIFFDEKAKQTITKNIYDSEILVYESTNNSLFKKPTYVDCSQIFKMNKEELESLIDVNSQLYKETDLLDEYVIKSILEKIKFNIFKTPPYLSILEIKLDKTQTTFAESLYLCDQKFQEVLNEIKNNKYLDEDGVGIMKYNSSQNNENIVNKKRFQNGIEFCLLFLNEYFPDKIKDFNKLQGLDNKNVIPDF